MTIIFQVQIDPLNDRQFSPEELDLFDGEMNVFCSKLERISRDYIRAQMTVDGKVRNT